MGGVEGLDGMGSAGVTVSRSTVLGEGLTLLGEGSILERRWDEAAATFRRAAALMPGEGTLQINAGAALLQLHRSAGHVYVWGGDRAVKRGR